MESIPPLVSHFDGFVCLGFASHGVALLVCVLDDLRDVLRVERVHDVKGILALGKPTRSHLCREEPHELFVVFEHRPQFAHREFIVQWYIDTADLVESEQKLIAREDCLEEIFVDHVFRRKI